MDINIPVFSVISNLEFNFAVSDSFKQPSTFVNEKNMIQQIFHDAVYIGQNPMGYHLGIAIRFIDPKEILDAITKIKTTYGYHFMGFLNAMDYLVITQTGCKKYYFNQTKLLQKPQEIILENGNFLNVTCEFFDPKNARIFNSFIEICINNY